MKNIKEIINTKNLNLTKEQENELDLLFNQLGQYYKEKMKELCFLTLETCEIDTEGSLLSYFERLHTRVMSNENKLN
jgi:hypothetical protein